MNVPCGTTAEGLPVGMQILTKHFSEDLMFRIAHQYEMSGGFSA
jgi:aspartyl-tRNA(Asn)/glutamyl-tRNA(Gln) amidotransferase subunit A